MRHKAYTLHNFIYIKPKSKGSEFVVLQVQVVVSQGVGEEERPAGTSESHQWLAR